MKKFTKIALIFAVVLAGIGLVCLMISFALGLTWGRFSDMVKNDRFNFTVGSDSLHVEESEEVIANVEEEFRNLDIEFSAGMLEVSYADVEQVQVQQENVHGFKRYVEENTLHIEGGSKLGVNNTEGIIKVQIPLNMTFDEIDLEIGAGKAELKDLAANSVDIEVGAGETTMTGLDVKRLNAEISAGQLCVELVDSEAAYSYEAECDVGEIQIGTTSVGSFGGSKTVTNPGANRYLDLECGVGRIQIEFQK